MLTLLKNEIKYNIKHWVPAAGIIFLICILQAASDDFRSYPAYMFAFIMVNNINAFTMKEKRNKLYALLPVTLFKSAVVRVMLIYLPFVLLLAIYITFQFQFNPEPMSSLHALTIVFGVILIIYSTVFIFDDTLTQILKGIGIDKKKIMFILVLFIALLNLLGVLAFMSANKGESSVFIEIIQSVENVVKTTNFARAIFSAGIILTITSIFTFQRRKVY